jgi:hypothetical protein
MFAKFAAFEPATGVEQRQRRGVGLVLRRQFEQDLVLVDRRVDGRDPARTVGVVEGVLNLVRRDSESRRFVTIDVDVYLRTGNRQVARQVLQSFHRP